MTALKMALHGPAGAITILDITNGLPIATFDEQLNGPFFQFSKRGDKLVTNGDKMKLWDTKNGSLIAQLGNHLNYSAVFNNKETRLLTKNDNCAQIWDTTTGECLATLEECTRANYNDACTAIITSHIVSSSLERKHTIKIYDAQTFKCIAAINVPRGGNMYLLAREATRF